MQVVLLHSPAISSQFTPEVCALAENRKSKVTKIAYFGGTVLFKVINVDTLEKLVKRSCYGTCIMVPVSSKSCLSAILFTLDEQTAIK